MGEFLTTSGLTFSIEKIIKNARKKIIIVSPYIKISRNYHERLLEAEKRRVNVTIVFGKEVLTADQDELLTDFDRLNLYYCDNLHAKCYMNEDTALIGSMNLYEYSQVNNREMGILIERQKESNIYQDIENEVESIIGISEKLVKDVRQSRNSQNWNSGGTCIRCGSQISFNPDAPFCKKCFNEWNRFANPFYTERYCHMCGKPEESSMEKPLCYSCFRSL